MEIKISERPARILHFDIENRPLSYGGSDFTFGEITAIAASWSDQKKIHCWVLGESEPIDMLSEFRDLYDEADLVTGHYIRAHDLPAIQGSLMEYEMELLGPKLTSDTCSDLKKRKGISKSQESLAAMYGLSAPKHHMTQTEWREANRLKRLDYTKKRVRADIVQHKELRARLIDAGALKENRIWVP